jgi:hypothetical protein
MRKSPVVKLANRDGQNLALQSARKKHQREDAGEQQLGFKLPKRKLQNSLPFEHLEKSQNVKYREPLSVFRRNLQTYKQKL